MNVETIQPGSTIYLLTSDDVVIEVKVTRRWTDWGRTHISGAGRTIDVSTYSWFSSKNFFSSKSGLGTQPQYIFSSQAQANSFVKSQKTRRINVLEKEITELENQIEDKQKTLKELRCEETVVGFISNDDALRAIEQQRVDKLQAEIEKARAKLESIGKVKVANKR